MKSEIYSSYKMLEALNVGIKNMWANDHTDSARNLHSQYNKICNILKEHLSSEEFKMIQLVEPIDPTIQYLYPNEKNRELLHKLVTASDITLAYLRSLGIGLNKDLIKKQMELTKKEDELNLKIKEVDLQREFLKNLIDIFLSKKEGVSELMRSEIMGRIKENHRKIEKNTNPNSKSQKKGAEEKNGK